MSHDPATGRPRRPLLDHSRRVRGAGSGLMKTMISRLLVTGFLLTGCKRTEEAPITSTAPAPPVSTATTSTAPPVQGNAPIPSATLAAAAPIPGPGLSV